MDFFRRIKLCPAVYLTFFHIERSALVKRLAGSQKGWLTCPTLTKCVTQGSTRILIWMDFFQSHKLCPNRCYLTFFRFNLLVMTGLKGNWSNLPLNKVLLQGSTRILIYIDGLLSVAQTVPKPLLSYLLPYSRTFNCTSKTTGWFTKGLKLIKPAPR
jgi:hypothetical protein